MFPCRTPPATRTWSREAQERMQQPDEKSSMPGCCQLERAVELRELPGGEPQGFGGQKLVLILCGVPWGTNRRGWDLPGAGADGLVCTSAGRPTPRPS